MARISCGFIPVKYEAVVQRSVLRKVRDLQQIEAWCAAHVHNSKSYQTKKSSLAMVRAGRCHVRKGLCGVVSWEVATLTTWP